MRLMQRPAELLSAIQFVAKIFCFGLLLFASAHPHQSSAADSKTRATMSNHQVYSQEKLDPINTAKPTVVQQHIRANFGHEIASRDARRVADWIVLSGDNQSKSFVIVDKTAAKVFVFSTTGILRGAAPVLLGLAKGDDSIPGIGARKLSSIRPDERTTPAGRFVASLGHNLQGVEILWVDYEASISLHRVITAKHKEHRLQRLASPTPFDNRISYGCINVPVKFFNTVVRPAFLRTNGIVYILPEIRSVHEVFSLPK